MYIEFLITLQTIFFGIFLYIYLNERSQQERLLREISTILSNKIINYFDKKLDIDLVIFIKQLLKYN